MTTPNVLGGLPKQFVTSVSVYVGASPFPTKAGLGHGTLWSKQMKMYYCEDDLIVEYALKTDPPDAEFWSTYKLKKSDIKIVTKMNRSDAAEMRTKILTDIFSIEPNIRTTKAST